MPSAARSVLATTGTAATAPGNLSAGRSTCVHAGAPSRDPAVLALATNRLGVPGLDNVVISLRDITGRVRTEEELRQSQYRYRNLFENVSDGIFVIGEDGRVLEVNDGACAQLGYDRAGLLAMNVREIVPGLDEEVTRRAQRIMDQSKGWYSTEHRRKDGTRVDVEVSIAPIVFEGKTAFLAVARYVAGRRPVEG